MKKNKNEEVGIVCTVLNNQNKKYVLAVANALKFTQEVEEINGQSKRKPKPKQLA